MRATEAGSQVPTGTPGSGLPLPIEPRAEPRPREAPARSAIAIGPLPNDGTVVRAVAQSVIRAYCEHRQRCGRLDVDATTRCMESGVRVREELGAAGCPYSFDADEVVACLTTIGQSTCELEPDEVAALERCRARAMCLPR